MARPKLLIAFSSVLTVAACKRQQADTPAEEPKASPTAPAAGQIRVTHAGDAPAAAESDDAELSESIAENYLMGAPILKLNFGDTTRIGRNGYALGHSNELKIPLWVCEHVVKADLQKNCERGDWFKADPDVPDHGRAAKGDYKDSGFDRGHMAPAADFSFSCDEMRDSFFLSNMAPQVGVGMNQHVWQYLEGKVRDWVEAYDEAWIVTGPVFLDDGEGLYCESTIGEGEVGVPDGFYKAVVVEDEGKHKAVGFILSNKKYPTSKGSDGDFSEFVVSIDEIEERTGIDLFSELPSNVEGPLESATADPGAW